MNKRFLFLLFVGVWLLFNQTWSVEFSCSRNKEANSIYLGDEIINLTTGPDILNCSNRIADKIINTLGGNDVINTLKSSSSGTIINLGSWDDVFNQNFNKGVLNGITIDWGKGYDKLVLDVPKENILVSGDCSKSCILTVKDKWDNPSWRFKNVKLKSIEEIDTLSGSFEFSSYSPTYLNFYGNVNLDLCLPFWNRVQLVWWYWKWKLNWLGSINSAILKSQCNTCYVPIFKGDFKNNIDASIDAGQIILSWSKRYRIDIKYLWGYFGVGGTGGYNLKVTSKVKLGSNYYSVWDFNDPILGNVLTGNKEISLTSIGNTTVSIVSQVWNMKTGYSKWIPILCKDVSLYSGKQYELGKDNKGNCYYRLVYYHIPSYSQDKKNWRKYKLIEGDKNTSNVIVLKNGDSIDKILANYNTTVTHQPGIKNYIRAYVKDNKIVLDNNQFLYLFEFNDINKCKLEKKCDFQDLVVLITIVPIKNNMSGSESNVINMDGQLGIYYNCNDNKQDIIDDVCKTIAHTVINDSQFPLIGFDFKIKWLDMVKYAPTNYMMVFKNGIDLYSFYEQYCQKPKAKISLINLVDLLSNVRKIIDVCVSNFTKVLPSYIKLDAKKSTIIFEYGRNYELKR